MTKEQTANQKTKVEKPSNKRGKTKIEKNAVVTTLVVTETKTDKATELKNKVLTGDKAYSEFIDNMRRDTKRTALDLKIGDLVVPMDTTEKPAIVSDIIEDTAYRAGTYKGKECEYVLLESISKPSSTIDRNILREILIDLANNVFAVRVTNTKKKTAPTFHRYYITRNGVIIS